MNLALDRNEWSKDGIFGRLLDENGQEIAVTCEHAYSDGSDAWASKIPPGLYQCVKGMHRLHGHTLDFETFEIIGVHGHSGLLFHCGNTNEDSEGCVLLGLTRTDKMILSSRMAFDRFMLKQKGVTSFTLVVF